MMDMQQPDKELSVLQVWGALFIIAGLPCLSAIFSLGFLVSEVFR